MKTKVMSSTFNVMRMERKERIIEEKRLFSREIKTIMELYIEIFNSTF